ncbi:hypothetical protein ACT4UT_28835, partial [Bacillus sp. B-TM1]
SSFYYKIQMTSVLLSYSATRSKSALTVPTNNEATRSITLSFVYLLKEVKSKYIITPVSLQNTNEVGADIVMNRLKPKMEQWLAAEAIQDIKISREQIGNKGQTLL